MYVLEFILLCFLFMNAERVCIEQYWKLANMKCE
jgi:hypothetical protein